MNKINKSKQEGVITLYDDRGELTGMVIKDEKTKKNIFFKCSEMGFDEIGELFETKKFGVEIKKGSSYGGGANGQIPMTPITYNVPTVIS